MEWNNRQTRVTRAVASLSLPGGQDLENFLNLSSFSCSFSYFSSNFLHFLPHFGFLGGRFAHPARPWLRHWGWRVNAEWPLQDNGESGYHLKIFLHAGKLCFWPPECGCCALFTLVTFSAITKNKKQTNKQTNKTKQNKLDMLPALRHRPLTDPRFPVHPANVMQVYKLHGYT